MKILIVSIFCISLSLFSSAPDQTSHDRAVFNDIAQWYKPYVEKTRDAIFNQRLTKEFNPARFMIVLFGDTMPIEYAYINAKNYDTFIDNIKVRYNHIENENEQQFAYAITAQCNDWKQQQENTTPVFVPRPLSDSSTFLEHATELGKQAINTTTSKVREAISYAPIFDAKVTEYENNLTQFNQQLAHHYGTHNPKTLASNYKKLKTDLEIMRAAQVLFTIAKNPEFTLATIANKQISYKRLDSCGHDSWLRTMFSDDQTLSLLNQEGFEETKDILEKEISSALERDITES